MPGRRLALIRAVLLYCMQQKYDKARGFMIKEETHSSNNHSTTPSGLERARLALAISAGKLAGAPGGLLGLGGGASLPGLNARRIYPKKLKSVFGASKAKKIVINGSNGKTTTPPITAALA